MCKKTSQQWFNEIPKEYKLVILDPDGWDRLNYDHSFYEELITQEEFDKRLGSSTLESNVSFFNWKP